MTVAAVLPDVAQTALGDVRSGRFERSLSALGLLDTQVLLPGHGPAWRGPVREAAELALQRS